MISNCIINSFKTQSKTIGENLRNPFFNCSQIHKTYNKQIKGIILNNSGTFIDPFSIAPTIAFVKVFKKFGINISMKESRIPMGIKKDLHIKELLKIPDIQNKWINKYCRKSNNEDIKNIYKEFIPIQLEILPKYCNLVPKVVETIDLIKKKEIKFGITSEFSREISNCILENIEDTELLFENIVAQDDYNNSNICLKTGLQPYMIYKNMEKLNITEIDTIIKVDNTIRGLQEGINAGCWTIGITNYSNYMNIDSIEQWENMSNKEKYNRRKYVKQKMKEKSGAHYIINEFEELIAVIEDINTRLYLGEKP
tara:strand:- start:602 stop:1534 length:933 start_codon:yes stop_codon:yes gene_type:complete